MTEDLGEENIVGNILGFELVATEGAVGAAQVAWFPREVEGAEGGGNGLWELGGPVRETRDWSQMYATRLTSPAFGSMTFPFPFLASLTLRHESDQAARH